MKHSTFAGMLKYRKANEYVSSRSVFKDCCGNLNKPRISESRQIKVYALRCIGSYADKHLISSSAAEFLE